MGDNVKSPSHYTYGEIEVIDYIKDKLTSEQFEGYCLGNVIKYVSRYRLKGGVEDIQKADVYLNWAKEAMLDTEQETLTDKIKEWAKERGLDKGNPDRQMHKLMEEIGELAKGLVRNDQAQVIDGIGDVYVVLTILAMQLNMDIKECIQVAYDEIADRKGQMVNGVFIKEEDLD